MTGLKTVVAVPSDTIKSTSICKSKVLVKMNFETEYSKESP